MLGGTSRSGDLSRAPSNGKVVPIRHHTVASLFSGIGGFDLGFERAGFSVTYQCELSEFCRAILAKHFPDVPRSENIKEINGSDIPPSDVWVGGFPCQDVSLARMGRRDGLKGTQSGLFFEFARLVGEVRPRVLVLENVAGLLSSHQGRDFGTVLGTLADLGYSLGWRVLNSKNFGVPQSRQRVFIVGCHQDGTGPAQILFEPERREGHAPAGRQNGTPSFSPFKRVVEHPGREGAVTPAIAYCLYAESARHTGTDWSRNYVVYPKKGEVRRLMPSECEGVMAFPSDWTVPQEVHWDEETYDTLRYHALGNAITPPVAEWLAHRVRQYLEDANTEEEQCGSHFDLRVAAASTS
jgi:DNA (cytosine-5)-methyltransferase 1